MSRVQIIKALFWLILALVVSGLLITVAVSYFQEGGASNIILGIVLIVFSVIIVTIINLPFLKVLNRKSADKKPE